MNPTFTPITTTGTTPATWNFSPITSNSTNNLPTAPKTTVTTNPFQGTNPFVVPTTTSNVFTFGPNPATTAPPTATSNVFTFSPGPRTVTTGNPLPFQAFPSVTSAPTPAGPVPFFNNIFNRPVAPTPLFTFALPQGPVTFNAFQPAATNSGSTDVPNPFAGDVPNVQSPFGVTFRASTPNPTIHQSPGTAGTIAGAPVHVVSQPFMPTPSGFSKTNPPVAPVFAQSPNFPNMQPLTSAGFHPQTGFVTVPTSNPFIATSGPNAKLFTASSTATLSTSITTMPTVTLANTHSGMPAVTSVLPFTTMTNSLSIPSTTMLMSQAHVPTMPMTTASQTNPTWSSLHTTESKPKLNDSLGLATSQAKDDQTRTSSKTTQQRILETCLGDPYGRQDYKPSTVIEMKPSSRDIASTTSSLSSTHSTVTTSTPVLTTAPVILPLQSNMRKTAAAHPVVDLKLNLRPASAPTEATNEQVSPNVSSRSSSKSVTKGVASDFTNEEEMALMTQKKRSGLRLPEDFLNPSVEPKQISTLYPIRRLGELEALTQMIARANVSVPTATNRASNSADLEMKQGTASKETSSFRSARLPILTRNRYYVKPTMAELKLLSNENGECIVDQFTIGHEEYGSITFQGSVNLSDLNLDDIVIIQRHEIIVYPDEDQKPPVGEGLNRPAQITLRGTYPTDRTTHEEITDIDRLQAMNYGDYLRQVTAKFDGEFVHYDANDGSWTFVVKHFSRYGLDSQVIDDQPTSNRNQD